MAVKATLITMTVLLMLSVVYNECCANKPLMLSVVVPTRHL